MRVLSGISLAQRPVQNADRNAAQTAVFGAPEANGAPVVRTAPKLQDQFNEGGIEVNSPHYTSLRDGSRIQIPDQYIPKNYREPVFGIREMREPDTVLDGSSDKIPSNMPGARS